MREAALAYHNLTTQVPHKVYIALPQSNRRPRIKRPDLDIVWLSKASYENGIEDHFLDGVTVPIYSKAKTVADCFKFRRKLGKDISIESLKDYVQLPGAEIDKLLQYARVNRVENVMRPYLEVITS
jgi:predicted transcriptional regulator of viral defense system